MAWSVQNIITELSDISQLIAIKRTSKSANCDDMERTLLKNVTYKLEAMKLTPADACALQKALRDNHSLSGDMKQMIETVIDTNLSGANDSKPVEMVKPQSIVVCRYLTMADWGILRNSTSYTAKVTTICSRLRGIGVRSLAEQTVKSAVASILSCCTTLPDKATMFQMVQDVKLGFASAQQPVQQLPFVVKYPDDPTLLSPILMAHGYKDEKPASIMPEKYAVVMKQIPLRQTNAAIASARVSKQAHTASSSGSTPDASMTTFMEMASGFMKMMANMTQNKSSGTLSNLVISPKKEDESTAPPSTKPQALPALEVEPFKPKMRTSTSGSGGDLLPLENGEVTQQDAPGDSGDGSVIEQAAFDALVSREAAKKATKSSGKGKGKGKGKAKAKTNPKAKASSKAKAKAQPKPKTASKRKASTKEDFVYDPGFPGAEWKGRSYESWTSKHYHAARELARNQGLSDDDAKGCAREARAKSAETWKATFKQ